MWAVFSSPTLVLVFASGIYARHHRRQIQMEDGTWVESLTHEERKEHFDKLRRNGSKGRMYLYLGLACNMGGLAIVQLITRMARRPEPPFIFWSFYRGYFVSCRLCLA